MRTYPRLAAVALLAGLVAACSSCSSSAGWSDYAAGAKDKEVTTPLTVEQLSAKVRCKPKMQVEGSDLRTGYCKTSDGEFFVNTFASEALKDAWMNEAPEYNPHLVGFRWTVLGPLNVLKALQEPLNGDLHLTDHRVSGTPTPQG